MTQNQQILDHLKRGESLTPLEALSKFGTLRLGARIYDLKRAGHNIAAFLIETPSKKHVACYRLV